MTSHARSWSLGLAAVAALACAARAAPELREGDAAPAVSAKAWLNVKPGETPGAAAFKDKVVMIEFWGTWCGPCVRAMPHVQELWDRYRDRGLMMVAISYEEPEVTKPFLEKNGYTMPVGADPEKTCISAYSFSGWPHTFVIGKDGKIAYSGDPYGVESAIEKALGLEASPPTLLTNYFAAVAAGDAAKTRDALERLVEKAPVDFALRKWAADGGGTAPAKPPTSVDGAKTLTDLAKAGRAPAPDAAKRQAALDSLAAAGPEKFDLAAWARDAFGRDFPITAKEFAQILDEKKFDVAIDALIDRHPSDAVVSAASKCIPLAVHCTQKAAETRSFGRKAVMCVLFPFAGRQPKDNEAFWNELCTSGMCTSEDKQHVLGILIGGNMVMTGAASSYAERQYSRAFVMDALKDGKKPALSKMRDDVAKDTAAATKELKAKYDK